MIADNNIEPVNFVTVSYNLVVYLRVKYVFGSLTFSKI